MPPDQLERVLRHALFWNLDHDRLRAHLQPLAVRCYEAGESVAQPGLRRPGLHLVLSGRLLIFDVTPGGRRLVVDAVEAGGLDGLLAVAGLRGHFADAAIASEVATISRQVVDRMTEAEPRLATNLLWFMSRRLRRREDHLMRLTLRDPSQRLAAQLLALAEPADPGGDQAVAPRLSHETLADLLGLRRETVTLHLARLRRLGALRVEERHFRVRVPVLEAVRDGALPGASGQG